MQESQPLNHAAQNQNARKPKSGFWFFLFLLFLFFSGSSYSMFMLAKLNQGLLQEIDQLKQTSLQTQTQLSQLQSVSDNWQKDREQLNTLLHKQNELEAAWQQLEPRTSDHMQLNLAKEHLFLADQAFHIAHDSRLTQYHLQLAIDILNKQSNTHLQPLKDLLQHMLTQLQNTNLSDISIVQKNLIALQKNLQDIEWHSLQIPNSLNIDTSEKNTFKLAWQTFINSLKSFVIIRHSKQDTPLHLPEEKFALSQNLNQQVNLALLATQAYNQNTFDACIQNLQAWISKYADPHHPISITLQTQLQDLKQTHLQLPDINFQPIYQQLENISHTSLNAASTDKAQSNTAPASKSQVSHQSQESIAPAIKTALAKAEPDKKLINHEKIH